MISFRENRLKEIGDLVREFATMSERFVVELARLVCLGSGAAAGGAARTAMIEFSAISDKVSDLARAYADPEQAQLLAAVANSARILAFCDGIDAETESVVVKEVEAMRELADDVSRKVSSLEGADGAPIGLWIGD